MSKKSKAPYGERPVLCSRIPGVQWAVRFFRALPRATAPDGKFRTVVLMGLDDATLVGAPHGKMILGSLADLDQPDSVVIDRARYLYFFPGEPLALGKTFELNDHRVRVVGIAEASAPFATFPVFFSTLQAGDLVCGQGAQPTFLRPGKPRPGISPNELATRIQADTGLKDARP